MISKWKSGDTGHLDVPNRSCEVLSFRHKMEVCDLMKKNVEMIQNDGRNKSAHERAKEGKKCAFTVSCLEGSVTALTHGNG